MDDVRNKIIAVLLGLVIVLVVTLMLTRIINYGITSPEDHIFRSTFSEIKVGISEEDVITFLGRPDSRSSEFHLGQSVGFEDLYLRAEVSGAKEFLFWDREIDLVYVVGVDGTGRVVLLEKGGT